MNHEKSIQGMCVNVLFFSPLIHLKAYVRVIISAFQEKVPLGTAWAQMTF